MTSGEAITKFEIVWNDDGFSFCIARREGGKFDIYWNCTLVDSPKDAEAVDVGVSFDTLYMKIKGKENDEISKWYDEISTTKYGKTVSYDKKSDSKTKNKNFRFSEIFFQNVK